MSINSPISPRDVSHVLSRRALVSSAAGGALALLSACSNPLSDGSGDGGLGAVAPKHQPIFVTASRKNTNSSGLDSDITYELDDHGNVVSASGTASIYKSDENGKPTQEVEEYSLTITFTVDENGWATDRETTSNTDTGEHSDKIHIDHEFNDDGTLAKKTLVDSDDSSQVSSTEYEYEYDDDGNLAKETMTYSSTDGSSTYVDTTLYNADGFVTEMDHEGGSTTSTSTYEYETDDDGVVTAANISEDFGQSHPLRSRLEFEYDDDGNISKVTSKIETVESMMGDGTISYQTNGNSEYTYQRITDPSDAAVFDAATKPVS